MSMRGFKPYPGYKDSGVERLGEIQLASDTDTPRQSLIADATLIARQDLYETQGNPC